MEKAKTTHTAESLAAKDGELRYQNLKLLYDFQMTTVVEAANNLAKGLPIYLTIIAALIAYFISQDISAETKRYAIGIAILVSVLAIIAFSSITWGIIKGVQSIKHTLRVNDPALFEELNMNAYFNKGIKTIGLATSFALIAIAIFMVGLYLI